LFGDEGVLGSLVPLEPEGEEGLLAEEEDDDVVRLCEEEELELELPFSPPSVVRRALSNVLSEEEELGFCEDDDVEVADSFILALQSLTNLEASLPSLA